MLTRFNAILGTLFVVVVVVGPPQELRDDTAATVRYLLGQGVAIKVLSGDAQRAVAAIAERAGIPVTGPPCDASALSDDQVAAALASTSVLGRASGAPGASARKNPGTPMVRVLMMVR